LSDNEWHQSLLEAMEHGQREWIRIEAHKTLHGYVRTSAAGLITTPPVWPELSLGDLLELGFKDHNIDTLQHPVLKKLRGESL
jgi:hypothetical protein